MNTLPSTRAAAQDSARVADALDRYYRTHGLPADGGASDAWFRVHIGTFSIPLPNPPARRRAVFFHDVNHLVTGYDTTFSGGEMQIGAFEVGAGCGRYLIAWLLNLDLLALGLVAKPRTVFTAFLRGRRSASLYRQGLDAATLGTFTVAEVRSRLRLDADRSPARLADRLVFAAWGLVAITVFVAPILLIAAALWTLVALLARTGS